MDCFHSVILWSPVDTASTFPVIDQLNRQTGASNAASRLGSHPLPVCLHIYTVLSSEQLANKLLANPVLGAHATSLTQSAIHTTV